MKHKHHIIPKHAGGTDDPSNIVELTVEEHAEAHRLLYEEHGKIQDKLAWLGLTGVMQGKDIIEEILRQPKSEEWKSKNRKPKTKTEKYFGNTNATGNKGKAKTEKHKENIAIAHTGMVKPWLIGNDYGKNNKGHVKTKEHQSKINESLNTKEVKNKIKVTWENKKIIMCPHCGLEGKEGHNMKRYHFEIGRAHV